MVGGVGVEAPLDGPRRDLQGLASCRRLDGLEVQAVDGTWPYERLDLGDDFRVEGFFEAPFLAPSCAVTSTTSSWVSAQRSHACQ